MKSFKVYYIFSSIFYICLWLQNIAASPQIFSNINHCTHKFNDKEKIVFAKKSYTVYKKQFTIHFSLCSNLLDECGNKSAACLVKRNSRNVISLGNSFFPSTENDDLSLQSRNGSVCNSKQKYSLTVNLQCSNSIKPLPRIVGTDDDECAFEINMMSPNCAPKCTGLVNDQYLIDLRNIQKNMTVFSQNKTFSLTLCGQSKSCGAQEIGACEILDNHQYIPLASVESQHINYDPLKNELTARGRFKHEGVIKELQILIKCNWEAELANAVYKKPQIQGKRYRFEVESSFGCVKLPQNCYIMDIDNLKYNLSGLYKPNGHWQVRNYRSGKMILNICGPLEYKNEFSNPNKCSAQYSQVCTIHGNEYTNIGTIASDIHVEENNVNLRFVSGSTCSDNSSLAHSTHIEFKCSRSEEGPSFLQYKECTTFLAWRTPHACPFDYDKGDNCNLLDRLGNRNLQNLHRNEDAMYFLSPNTTLLYNFCGSLHRSCNGFNNASFCLKIGQDKETVLGWNSQEVINDKGVLKMELDGTSCSNTKYASHVTTIFVCTFANPPPPSKIEVLHDNCVYKLTIYTSSACLAEKTAFESCVYKSGPTYYNLSALTLRDRNYVIRDSDENVDYIFNICGPLITDKDVLCRGNSMVCLRNNTEVNIKNKFRAIGNIAAPKLINATLVIESKMSTYCEELGSYKSVIYFKCSENEEQPKLLSKKQCLYNFIWKTRYACPKNVNCIVEDLEENRKFDLSKLHTRQLKVQIENDTNAYEFHLCDNVLIKHTPSNVEKRNVIRHLKYINNKIFVQIDVEEECLITDEKKIVNVMIELMCSRDIIQERYLTKSFENCTLNILLEMPASLCIEEKKELGHTYYINNTANTIVEKEVEKQPVPTGITEPIKRPLNCSYVNSNTGQQLSLNSVGAVKMAGGTGANYSLNSDNCQGFLCKNGVVIVPYVETCPDISYTNSFVKLLNFPSLSQKSCKQGFNFNLELLFNCNESVSKANVIKETACNLTIAYNSELFCSSSKPSDVTKIALITTLLFLGLLLVCVAVIWFLRNKHLPAYINIACQPKDAVSIYVRNSTV